MALTKIITGGITDDAVTSGKIPANAVGNSEIAAEAVTLDKLEHGTSSNNGKFLRANNGADPTFETINNDSLVYPNGNTGVLTSTNDVVEINGKVNWDNDPNNTYGISFDAPTTLTKDSNFTLPEDGSNGQYLKTNGSGVLSFATIAQPDLTNLSASNLTSGTVPDARFPATLPAVSGANLTNLPAATSTSGTNDFTVADGNLIIGTAGHGIDFSAQTTGGSPYTSSSSGNNVNPVEGELLDHYESGRWTPTFDYGITAGSTGSSGWGDYTKIGNLVILGIQHTRHGWADFSLSSGDSAIKISGLPFTPKDSGATGVVNIPALNYTGRTSNGQGGATVLIPPNSAYILISGLSGTTPRFHLHAMFSVAY